MQQFSNRFEKSASFRCLPPHQPSSLSSLPILVSPEIKKQLKLIKIKAMIIIFIGWQPRSSGTSKRGPVHSVVHRVIMTDGHEQCLMTVNYQNHMTLLVHTIAITINSAIFITVSVCRKMSAGFSHKVVKRCRKKWHEHNLMYITNNVKSCKNIEGKNMH